MYFFGIQSLFSFVLSLTVRIYAVLDTNNSIPTLFTFCFTVL